MRDFKIHDVSPKAPDLPALRTKGQRAISPADLERAQQDLQDATGTAEAAQNQRPVEIGGPKGPEPTRYGDWEVGGIVSDF